MSTTRAKAVPARSPHPVRSPQPAISRRHGEHRFCEYRRHVKDGHLDAVFAFATLDRIIEEAIPLATIAVPHKLRERLTALGVKDLEATEEWIKLFGTQREMAVNIVSVGGWQDESVLVNRYGAFGDAQSVSRFRFDPNSPFVKPAQQAGTLEAYLDGAGRLMKVSSPLTTTYAAALLPALASRLDLDGGQTHCTSGDGSLGKTSQLRFAQSQTTRALARDLTSINQSDGFADAILASAGGGLIAYSDLKASQMAPKDLVKQLRMIVFGTADTAHRRTLLSTAAASDRGYIVNLVSFEHDLASFFEEHGVAFEAGEQARIIDIRVAEPLGIFDRLRTKEGALKAIRYLEKLLKENYGHVTPRWADYLAALPQADLQQKFDEHVNEFVGSQVGLDNLGTRIAGEFGLLYAAGVIAEAADLFPATLSHLWDCLQLQLDVQIAGLPNHTRVMSEARQQFLGALVAPGKFPLAKVGEALLSPQAAQTGFRRQEAGGLMLFIRREYLLHLAQKALPAMHERLVENWLVAPVLEQAAAAPGTRPVQQLGLQRLRYVVLDDARLRTLLAAAS